MNSKSVSVYEFDFLNSLQNLFSVKFKITESLKLSYINFVKYLNICLYCIFFDWDSLHARLNSHYKAWSHKKKKHKKIKIKTYRKSV